MTHICVVKLTIIGSDNGLSPGRRQAIIRTNAGILLIWPLGANFSELSIGIQTFSFKKMHLKMSSAKWRPFFLGSNVLSVAMPCHDVIILVGSTGVIGCYIDFGPGTWSSARSICAGLGGHMLALESRQEVDAISGIYNSSPPGKMAAVSQTIFSDAFFWKKMFSILIKISQKFLPKGPIDNNPALVYIIAWRRIGDKPLSEPMLKRFIGAYMRH